MPAITIIRRPRIRYARIRVLDARTVQVTVPKSYRQSEIERLLEEKKRWILKHLTLQHDRAMMLKERRDEVMYLGHQYAVVFHEFADQLITLDDGQKQIIIRGDARLNWKSAVQRWCRGEAKKIITRRVHDINARFMLPFTKIFIRSQKTRWGTCSSKGHLSFNWKLTKAPPFVLDYVICHELAHTREFSHSKRFWRILTEMFPRTEEAKKWLKEHGYLLQDQ